jgi:hypothetical protein
MQNEITKSSDLLDSNGTLVQRGWMRRPLLKYSRVAVKAGWHRIKEWEYYAILNDNFGICMTIADLGYMSLASVTWLDFKERKEVTEVANGLLPRGGLNLPASSESGNAEFACGKLKLFFSRMTGKRVLTFSCPGFAGGDGISGEISLAQAREMDSMVIATPFAESPQHFFYNQKVVCMPAEGSVRVRGRDYAFSKDSSFGVLDWGRGVWPYKVRWYWGSASGIVEGKPFGFNIGLGFGDTSAATENLLVVDGKGHKLDQVTFHIDTRDYLKPWKFTSNDGRFEMNFEPLIDRSYGLNLLLLGSVQHQVFGRFNGHATLDDGRRVKVTQLIGFAEDVFNKW